MNPTDHFVWTSLLSLAAAGQGFFLSLVLAGRKQNSAANHILSVAMFLFSFELVAMFYHGVELDQRFPHLIGVTYAFPFLYTPLFLLYAQALTGSIHGVTRHQMWHFVPFAATTAYLIPFYLASGAEKLLAIDNPGASPWTQQLFVIDHLKFAYSLIYLVAILVVIDKHRKRVRDRFSSLDKVNLNWLRILAFGGFVTWVVALAFYVAGFFMPGNEVDPIEDHSDYVSLAMAAFVYTIGYMGLRQPEIFSPELAADEHKETAMSYAKSGITEAQMSDIETRLRSLMRTASPHRNPELTLPQLAEMLDATPHNLSQVINSRIGSSFYDFINLHRVEDVKRAIAEDQNAALTLLSIGLDAGFNSKSSFNAAFKKTTGVTPSEYRRQRTEAGPQDSHNSST